MLTLNTKTEENNVWRRLDKPIVSADLNKRWPDGPWTNIYNNPSFYYFLWMDYRIVKTDLSSFFKIEL